MTSVVVSTAWDLQLGPHNQTHSPFPEGDPGWSGQLVQWRWDDPAQSSWTGYVRVAVGVGRVHEQWVAGVYLRRANENPSG